MPHPDCMMRASAPRPALPLPVLDEPAEILARPALRAAALLMCAGLLGGCGTGSGTADPAPSGSSAPASAPAASGTPSDGGGSAPAEPAAPAVAGFAPGEIPPVPLFTLPDVSLMNSRNSAAVVDIAAELPPIEGITVAPASCDASGVVRAGGGSTILYGDGSAVTSNDDGAVVNYGDGSGTIVRDGVAVVDHGDGSGTYTGNGVQITTYGDGSGTYSDGTLSVVLHGDGSGTWTKGGTAIVNHGDGSATYTSGGVSIVNYGDCSGSYADGTVSIQNYGDGTALVDGVTIQAAPLPATPPVGTFPAMAALAPQTSCGVMVTLEDSVLFDFGSAELRPASQDTLAALANALGQLQAPRAIVTGHTDSISSDEFNQDLSERRAAAVVSALMAAGVTTPLEAVGKGESEPVAPNENPDGTDNPAGRQLNRRVEIFIPNA